MSRSASPAKIAQTSPVPAQCIARSTANSDGRDSAPEIGCRGHRSTIERSVGTVTGSENRDAKLISYSAIRSMLAKGILKLPEMYSLRSIAFADPPAWLCLPSSCPGPPLIS